MNCATREAILLLALMASIGSATVIANGGRDESRSPAEILAEIDRIEMPQIAQKARGDAKVLAGFLERLRWAMGRKSSLALELFEADPNHDRLPRLLGECWQYRIGRGVDEHFAVIRELVKADPKNARSRVPDPTTQAWYREIVGEIDRVASRTSNRALKDDAIYWRADLAVRSSIDRAAALPAVEEFIRVAPKDMRGGNLLFEVAMRLRDPEKQRALLTRVLADYPDGDAALPSEQLLGTLEGVGKPFDLDFADAITGRRISMTDLRGRVVVVEFWATWCGPCVAEMPKMKALYEEYRGRGVEFIGVSLDRKEEGGLEKLRQFVEQNQIRWPQYYLNDRPEGGPARAWALTGLPTVFVVDRQGKLASVYARGKMEKILTGLLASGEASDR